MFFLHHCPIFFATHVASCSITIKTVKLSAPFLQNSKVTQRQPFNNNSLRIFRQTLFTLSLVTFPGSSLLRCCPPTVVGCLPLPLSVSTLLLSLVSGRSRCVQSRSQRTRELTLGTLNVLFTGINILFFYFIYKCTSVFTLYF